MRRQLPDLLETIWLERRKELWGEGFSLIDIIRNQQTVVRKAYPDKVRPSDKLYKLVSPEDLKKK